MDEASVPVLVEHGVDLFGDDGVDAVRSGSDGWTLRWDGNLERNKGSAAKIGFGYGKDVRKIAKNVAQSGDDCRRPAGAVEIEHDTAQM